MKKTLLLLVSAACWFGASAQTPTITEPDFVGEVIAIMPNGDSKMLEKQTVMLRTRAGFSFGGFGSAKQKLIINGGAAEVRLDGNNKVQLIVKAVDNATDPLSIINIFAFDANNKQRLAELASINSFGTVKEGKMKRMNFTAKKYGAQSYLITLTDTPVPDGEYGIIVTNPNNRDEKNIVVSSFGVGETKAAAKAAVKEKEPKKDKKQK